MSQSRRTFLQQVSSAAAVGVLAGLTRRVLWAATPNELLPSPDEALLRELALKAIDAARGAGAGFADVRLGIGREVVVACGYQGWSGWQDPVMEAPKLECTAGYGIRALVAGAWGFAAGYELTADAVTRVACAAVARARANRPRRPRTLELAPAPVVRDGRWTTPIAQDPFAVTIGEQGDLGLAAVTAAAKVQGVRVVETTFSWQRADQVFASTEGSLVVQRLDMAFPTAGVTAVVDQNGSTAELETLRQGGYGYEAIDAGTLVTKLRQAADRAVEDAKRLRPAPTSVEVGRYDLVFSAQAVARLLVGTTAEAVDLERALGFEANDDGTSFAAPPAEVLGKYQVGSKLITMTADRTRPHGAGTVGWDDEGVKPEEYTFVRDGVIVDYHSDRQTAAALAPWYGGRGEPVRSHGCAAGGGRQRPVVHLPNLTLHAGRNAVSVDDLIAGTARGLYIERCGGSSDQQVLSSQYAAERVREIRSGKLGGPIADVAFHFITPQFWSSVDAIGGSASAVSGVFSVIPPFDALQLAFRSVATVPIRARQVNVLNTGRTA